MARELVIIGIILGFIFYELTKISPGGVIVPGLLAYYIYDPKSILVTLLIALASYFICFGLSHLMILFGRRLYIVHILVGVFLSIVLYLLSLIPALHFLSISPIGYIIPGIISYTCAKQGPIKTFSGLTFVTGLVFLISLLFR
jgi:poly-gamma-glutamate biosynthesis protein PgsC/CapC